MRADTGSPNRAFGLMEAAVSVERVQNSQSVGHGSMARRSLPGLGVPTVPSRYLSQCSMAAVSKDNLFPERPVAFLLAALSLDSPT